MGIKVKWNSLTQHRVWATCGFLFSILGAGLLWYLLQRPTVGNTQQLGDVGQEPLHATSCELSSLLQGLRTTLTAGSPAAQRYLQEMVEQVAVAGSFDELQMLVAQERDPAVLEVLAHAVVSRSHHLARIGDPVELRPLLDRLATEANPTLRAALVRPLGRTIEPVSGLYAQLIQDPAQEVREAVVAVVLAGEKIGYGHVPEIAERAIAVAVAAQSVDPEAGARILESVDIRTAGTEAINKVLDLLRADNAQLRRGAAVALGTVGASNAQRTTDGLVTRYQTEPDRNVRTSILQSIVRMRFAHSVPILETLRGIDRALDAEIDSWLMALQLNQQEWEILLREKERLAKAKGA